LKINESIGESQGSKEEEQFYEESKNKWILNQNDDEILYYEIEIKTISMDVLGHSKD
jgi:hypothetical protein